MTQTGSIGTDERALRAGEARHSDSFCCVNATTMETRWRCRASASLAGLRPRCGFAKPPAGAAAPRAIAPQIVLPAACNTRRFCVPNGVERCATDFLP
ncbi:hypothetical protein WJ47_13725 [Burkholderia ubonensis]|uniref:Uncharacterized protein n=1 Tax=Burkholderia ubonensis TaxID=101571 RepID=A0AB73G6L7_9BURK|nr:hypothetical protein WJ47_13725 [Burkholderia ubonensis]KVM30673.1 hypothetical protein WJ54_01045 [Burkholderia ubonensis]KVM37040.1 hypothetical protein WJ53_29430 [Burkholderia ubonensis]